MSIFQEVVTVTCFMIQTFLHKNMQVNRIRVHSTSRKYIQWLTL